MGSYSVRLLAQVVAGLEARQLDGGGAQRLAAAALELDGTQDGVWAQLNGRQQRWALGASGVAATYHPWMSSIVRLTCHACHAMGRSEYVAACEFVARRQRQPRL